MRVNTVAPGVVQTTFGKSNEEEYALPASRAENRPIPVRPNRRHAPHEADRRAGRHDPGHRLPWLPTTPPGSPDKTLVVDGGASVLPWTGPS